MQIKKKSGIKIKYFKFVVMYLLLQLLIRHNQTSFFPIIPLGCYT